MFCNTPATFGRLEDTVVEFLFIYLVQRKVDQYTEVDWIMIAQSINRSFLSLHDYLTAVHNNSSRKTPSFFDYDELTDVYL